jgi:hypothetical protein
MRLLVFLLAVLVSSGAAAADDTCASLIAALPKLSGGLPLQATGTGVTYKSLYDGCDEQNMFAGAPLPKHPKRPNERLKCSTDKNRVAFLVRYPEGTIVFSAKASVDADGSRLACGNKWPNQCGTWLQFDSGSQRTDVNAEDTPFVVVPGKTPGTNVSFQRDTRIRQGDVAVAVARGKCSFGVVGDSGPYFRLGELSLRAHGDLGNPQCAVEGQYPCQALKQGSGDSIGEGVTYFIFPRSRPARLLSQNVNALSRVEAENRVKTFLAAHAK